MKRITDFFRTCPALSETPVREDYLAPQSGSVAIAPDGGEQTVKTYASGDMLGQLCFKIMVRENFTGRTSVLLETIADWVNEAGRLPELEGDRISQYIEVTEGPVLVKTDIGAGVYEMKLRLVYYRKGKKI